MRWVCLLLLLLLLVVPGCQGRARTAQTVVSLSSLAGVLGTEMIPHVKACLWVSSLTTPSTSVSLVLAHDEATLAECLNHRPLPPPWPPVGPYTVPESPSISVGP